MNKEVKLTEELCALYRQCKHLDLNELKVYFPGLVKQITEIQETLRKIERVSNESADYYHKA